VIHNQNEKWRVEDEQTLKTVNRKLKMNVKHCLDFLNIQSQKPKSSGRRRLNLHNALAEKAEYLP
jgi:hypothetical protein